MWKVSGQMLDMTEGDFGVPLPLNFENMTISGRDVVNFVIIDGGNEIISKSFRNIQNNSVNLVITEEDTRKLAVGAYLYRLDWYQENAFMCNLAPKGRFFVSEKEKGAALP